jgi:pimeloyl-ACP methyl ester carboxylesterase
MEEGGTLPAGGAAGIGDFFSGITAAARRLLNYATYYQMKERAGKIGVRGAYALLRQIKTANPELRVHLVGHSFGGRLVTAAALGPPHSPSVAPASMTLLQSAFSHNGFARNFDGERDGFFRAVVEQGRVAGPILITHTKNDRAVGIAYPIASRIARQDSSDLGDADDVFGGIGRNGAQHTPEAEPGELLDAGSPYAFVPGKLYNLHADRLISGHSDVTGPAVIHAVLTAASG